MLFTPETFFDLAQTQHASLFTGCTYAWEALAKITPYVAQQTAGLIAVNLHQRPQRPDGTWIGQNVFIGAGTVVEPGATIKGPAIIGRNCQIRANAYIREGVIIGDDCVVGNATELKNALLFNGVQVPHYNYIGDSILGYKTHLGAGAKISNVKLFPGNIEVEVDGTPRDTGLRKFGALIGDGAEVGCNAVLNPGSLLGRNAVVYPNVFWRGILPANMIAKNKAEIEVVVKQPRA